jgi:hypothetical protein
MTTGHQAMAGTGDAAAIAGAEAGDWPSASAPSFIVILLIVIPRLPRGSLAAQM